MRKLLWSCTVACVLATGIFLTARHILLQEQDTLVVDSGMSSATAAAVEGGMALADQLFTTLHGWARGHGLVAGADQRSCRNTKAPAVPAAVPCEDVVPALPMGGVIELPPMPDNAAPATAIIHEESEVQLPITPVAHTEESKDLTMPGSGSTIEAPADGKGQKVCEMPRTTGCGTGKPMTEAPLHMPTCAESEEAAATPMPPAAQDAEEQNEKKEQEDAPGSSENSESSDPMSEATPSNDSPYHHCPDSCPNGSYCPYTGRCYPMPSYTEPRQPTRPKDSDKPHGKEETSEPPAPAQKSGKQTRIIPNNLIPSTLPTTNESGIDTMEYRRSDGSLNETDGGPF